MKEKTAPPASPVPVHYTVLARTYRPQRLDDVIGQKHVTDTLKNAVAAGRVAHAFVFGGPRGVGKTTTARILAKVLNCSSAGPVRPCNECANCREITESVSVDVQEIDGASNRGIDEIRDLRDNVKYAPANSPRKVYIIDEAHQITDAAFNALLKTLEEPPSHVVFILATTDVQKIPVTILSRCQRYRFRLLTTQELTAHLTSIAQRAKFDIEPEALHLIAVAAGGSVRDSLSLLDQVMSFAAGRVTAGHIRDLLGTLPRTLVVSAVDAIAASDHAQLIALVREVVEDGHSIHQFARDLREQFRCLMLHQVAPGMLEESADDRAVIDRQAGLFTIPWLVRSGRLMSRTVDELRLSDQPRLVMELALLKLAQPFIDLPSLLDRLERPDTGVTADEAAPVIVAERPRADTSGPADTYAVDVARASAADKPEETSESMSREDGWRTLLQGLRQEKPMLANYLGRAQVDMLPGGTVRLQAANNFEEEGIRRSLPLLEEKARAVIAGFNGFKLSVASAAETAGPVAEEIIVVAEAEPASQPPVYEVTGDAGGPEDLPSGLEGILKQFPGKVTKARPKGRPAGS